MKAAECGNIGSCLVAPREVGASCNALLNDANSPDKRLLTLPRHRGRWHTLPFEPPDTALSQVLHEIGTECSKTDPASVPDRWINDAIARSLLTKLSGQRLACRIGHGRIGLESRMSNKVRRAQIMKRTEKICDQLGIVSDVLKASDRLKLAGEMIRHLADRCFGFERAIPRSAAVIVEAIATRPGVGEGCVDKRVAGAPEHKLSRIEVRKAGLLGLQPAVGDTLQGSKIFKRTMIGGKRQQHRAFEAASRDEPYRIARGYIERRRQCHSQAATQSIDVLADHEHLGNAALSHHIERASTAV